MKFYFEEAELWKEKKASVIRRINELGVPLVIFGRSGASNPEFLRDVTAPVHFIVSTNPTSWGKTQWGLEVVSLDRIQHEYQQYTVLILPIDYKNEFVAMFQHLPNPPVEIFALDLHFEDEGTADYFKQNQSALEEIYEHMADQLSKDTYETMIRYRINRDPSLIMQIQQLDDKQYFLEKTPFLHDHEIFVDVGAYTGDTVQKFISAVNNQYNSIYALEAIPDIYKKLVENTKNYVNIFCHQVGIGGEKGILRFTSSGKGSHPDSSGCDVIQIDTLDHILTDIPITYLKMDIEGMEQPALRGAKNLIQSYRPKLGICIYHSKEDMLEVPKQILKLHPDYHLYCRHYTPSVCDTVCYAI